MSENRALPQLTREERVSRLSSLIQWIEREAETARGIRVVRAIAQHDLTALSRGQEPEPCDPDTICSYLRSDGDRLPNADAGDLVRNSKPEVTLEKRRHRLATSWAGDSSWLPKVTRHTGGGRGNQSHYRLEFERHIDVQAVEIPASIEPSGKVTYESRPAKSVWWLRWLFIPDGFALTKHSWRGLAFVGLLAITAMCIAAVAMAVYAGLHRASPVTAMDFLLLLMAASLVAAVWPTLRALRDAAEQRVVECPGALLSVHELYGQLRCTRRQGIRVAGGWLALVRISSTCPRCGGAVELMSGRADFPGRMVGRCRDAPSEHVFSFDPTTYEGQAIR